MQRNQLDTLDVTPEDGRDYTEVEVSDALGARTRAIFELDQAPRTMGELGALFEEADNFATGEGFTWEDLLISDGETRHEVRIGDEVHHAYCFLDALVLPFVLDRRVEIRSRPPGGGETVEVVATPRRLEATPASAVMSFGMSLDLPEAADELGTDDPAALLDLTHAEGCPRINAFPDEAAYRAWDREADAVSVVMTLAQAYAMAHDTAGAI